MLVQRPYGHTKLFLYDPITLKVGMLLINQGFNLEIVLTVPPIAIAGRYRNISCHWVVGWLLHKTVNLPMHNVIYFVSLHHMMKSHTSATIDNLTMDSSVQTVPATLQSAKMPNIT